MANILSSPSNLLKLYSSCCAARRCGPYPGLSYFSWIECTESIQLRSPKLCRLIVPLLFPHSISGGSIKSLKAIFLDTEMAVASSPGSLSLPQESLGTRLRWQLPLNVNKCKMMNISNKKTN